MSVSPDHYAEFLMRLGHSVRKSGGLYWFNTQPGIFSSFPYHREINADNVTLPEILGHDGFVARFGCPVEQGVPSFRISCVQKNYDFQFLRSRTRTQVRRGLELCTVEQVDFQTLRRHAVPLNRDTLIRQGRRVPHDLERYWHRYYDAAAQTQGAEAWAAFVDGEMAAYSVGFLMEDVVSLQILRSSTKHLDAFPNNALVFRYLQERMPSPEISSVCYGYESIQSGLGSLDQFKTGMGFEKLPAGQRIELATWVKPFVNRLTLPLAGRLLSKLGNGETVAKLKGIIDWYQQQPSLSDAISSPISKAA